VVKTIKPHAYGWLVVGQSVGAGLAYGIGSTPALSVTWTAPLQLRYAACGAIQVLYAYAHAFAFALLLTFKVTSSIYQWQNNTPFIEMSAYGFDAHALRRARS